MRDVRGRGTWRSAGPAAGIGALLLLAAINPGCSCSDDDPPDDSGSGGAGGGSILPGDLALESCHHDGEAFSSPFDATPDPDGNTVYFTAIGATGEAGIFAAACKGSLTTLAAGYPLVSPFNIATSTDGATLFIADPAANLLPEDDEEEQRGALFSIASQGGELSQVAGTTGTAPRGLEVREENGADTIWFTGRDPEDGQPGLFRIDAKGGTLAVVAKGAPFQDPGGVALADSGEAYVLDTDASGTRVGSVILVSGDTASEFVTDLEVGFPAGIALAPDGQTVMVSGIHPANKTDVVFVIDVETKEITEFTQGIDTFTESAGLHRAKNAAVFAWADSAADGSGTVYVLK